MTIPRQTVVLATDASFWTHTYVALHSLLVNNPDVPFDVQILSEVPDESFFANLPFLKALHSDVEIQWLEIDPNQFANAPIRDHFSLATYYRLLIARLLPETVQRIFYLDSDTVVRGSLRDLFELDVDDWVVAAIPEYLPQDWTDRYGTHAERIGLPEGTPHFNAGVLIINIERWRHLNIEEQCLHYIRENIDIPSRLQYPDQDTLNVVLAGHWRPIGPTFNYFDWTIDPKRFQDFAIRSQPGGEVPASGPLIAHFTGAIKPWHGGSPHPYEADYWHYRMATPYADRLTLLRSKVMGQWRKRVRPTVRTIVRRLPFGTAALRVAKSRLRAT